MSMSGRTYEQRHKDAMSVAQRISEGPAGNMGMNDPERSARFMTRSMGALGSFAMDNVFGDVWCRPQLSRRDRSLVVISCLMSLKSVDELKGHIRIGLNHGVTREEVREILLTVAGYAGFPTAMAASRHMDDVFRGLDNIPEGGRLPEQKPAPNKSDAQRWADAADVRRTLSGAATTPDPVKERAGMGGPVGELVFDFHFGEIWCRPEMSRRDRSLVVISILTALSMPAQLNFHIPAGLNHGLTREEIEEIMVQYVIYGGFPRSVVGMTAARNAWKRLDSQSKM